MMGDGCGRGLYEISQLHCLPRHEPAAFDANFTGSVAYKDKFALGLHQSDPARWQSMLRDDSGRIVEIF